MCPGIRSAPVPLEEMINARVPRHRSRVSDDVSAASCNVSDVVNIVRTMNPISLESVVCTIRSLFMCFPWENTI